MWRRSRTHPGNCDAVGVRDMKFEPMESPFSEMRMWGAKSKGFSFIITLDAQHGCKYTASVRSVIDATRSGMYELGGYNAHATWQSAVDACKKFLRERQ